MPCLLLLAMVPRINQLLWHLCSKTLSLCVCNFFIAVLLFQLSGSSCP